MSRSVKVKPKCIKKVEDARKRKFPSQKALAEEVGVSLCTVRNFLKGKPVDRPNFIDISDFLGLDWQKIAYWDDCEEGQTENAETPYQDWGTAPDISSFYGRQKELATIKQWTVQDRCRVAAIYGIGGIGKTALAMKLAKEIQGEFEYVIWRSLRNAPLLQEVLSSIEPLKSNVPDLSGNKIALSIKFFKHHRCLLILDEWEKVFASGKFAGTYQTDYQNYGELVRRIGESKHQSCLLLTSREKAREVGILEGETLPIRSLKLEGLDKISAKEILKEKGLSEEQQWDKLIQICRGNPLALKMLATTIKELSVDGSVSQFLDDSTASLFLGDIDYLLYKQYEKLPDLEKKVMECLASHETPVTASQMLDTINLVEPKEELRNALASLRRRCLIETVKEKEQTSFELQPVVKEFVKSRDSFQKSK